MSPVTRLGVERIAPPGGAHGNGINWFRVTNAGCDGRCFFTNGEAKHLHQRVLDHAERFEVDWRTAALACAIERVAEAAQLRAVYP